MRRKWRYVAVAACMGLVAAACGGDDDDGGAEGTEAPAGAEGTEAPAATEGGAETTEAETEETEPPSEDTEAEEETGASVDPASVETDIGIDDTTIRVGMLADLSGAFAPLVQEIVEAQRVYWDDVNANGGIAGRQIELIVEDTAYDVASTSRSTRA